MTAWGRTASSFCRGGSTKVPRRRGDGAPAGPYRQAPLWQAVPAAQAIAQPPQWVGSLARFTQAPPQSAVPGGQDEQQRKPVSAKENVGWSWVPMKSQAMPRKKLS